MRFRYSHPRQVYLETDQSYKMRGHYRSKRGKNVDLFSFAVTHTLNGGRVYLYACMFNRSFAAVLNEQLRNGRRIPERVKRDWLADKGKGYDRFGVLRWKPN